MPTKPLLAIAVVVLCAWLLTRSDDPSAGHGPLATPLPAPGEAGPDSSPADLAGPASQGPTAAERVELTQAAAPSPGPLVAQPPKPEFAPGLDLAVRVVAADGAPVSGAKVVVWSGDGSSARAVLTALTGAPGGDVIFRDLGVTLDRNWSDRRSVCVGLELAGEAQPATPLDVDALPAEPVVLVAPAHGRLEVRFVDLEARPLLLDEWVHLTPYPPDPVKPEERRRGARADVYVQGQAEATFALVEPGVDLLFEVSDKGIRRGAAREVSPLAPGEVRRLEVALGEVLPHVRGRIVDAAGAPVPARSIDVEFEPSGNQRIYPVGLDGSFDLSVARLRGAGDEFAASLRVELHPPGAAQHEVQRLSGRFVAPVPRGATPVDVGAVILRTAPVILTGRIVDPQGAPVEGAYISVYSKFNRGSDPEDFGWNFAGVEYAHSDPAGHVVVQGDLPAGEYAARAHGADRVDRGAQRFELGARGLEFVLDPAHFIRGRVRLPEGTRLEDLQVELQKEGADREWLTYASWRTGLAADGSFLLKEVRPGPVSLVLKRVDSAVPLATIRDIRPTPSRDQIPSPLDPWDLAGDLVRIATRVHLADGRPAPAGLVAIGPYAAAFEAGRCDASFDRQAGPEVLLVAPGHVPARFPLGGVPGRVDLVQGTPVEVSLASPVPPLPEGWVLELTLRSRQLRFVPEGQFFDQGGSRGRLPDRLWIESTRVVPGETSWTLHVPESGDYWVQWKLSRLSTDATRRPGASQFLRRAPAEEALVIEQVPSPLIRHRTTLGADQLAEAIESLRSL